MSKLHQILIAILVVQLALVAVVFWPRPAPANAVGAPFFSEINAADVTSLVIRDDQGQSIQLSKPAGQWILPEFSDYPVQADKVTPLLTKIADLTSDRLVTRTEASQKQLQVADDKYVRRLELKTSGDISQVLYLGSPAGAQTVHVRVGGQQEVYQARDLNTWDFSTDPLSWVDPVYLSVPQETVVTLTLGNANGQWTFEKDASGNWTMQDLAQGETFDTNNLTTVLNQATSVRMTRPLGKTAESSFGMDQPSALVTLKTQRDGQEKTCTLTIGAKDATDSSYVVKSSESLYYVKVAEYSVKDLVEKTRDGFLQLPPTPAVTPTPGA
ncbi:MAG: hypothetical protein CVU38_02785 [Chloroflexi bacterium HGW-Chloroflexi-1]|nr:MAG: hypothetical protein CVU38_02785 [Chloroflexi bacterium HGW-Chloroflexi-1]